MVLRDGCIGIGLAYFGNRWLALGTESKSRSTRSELPKDPEKAPRPITGEKGIGRLAIASIGRQVLILTCPKYSDEKQIVACFINWELFEIPGVNLEDLSVPIREFHQLPTASDIDVLKEEALKTITCLYEAGKAKKNSPVHSFF